MVKRETLVTSEQGAAVVVGAAPGRPPEQALRQSGASGAGLGAGSEYPLSSMAPVVAGAPGVETTQALTPSQAAEMPVYARDGVAQAGDAEPADSLLFAASADEAAVPGGISGPNSPGEGGRGRGGGDGRAGGGTSGEQPADGDDGDEERNVHAAGLFEVRNELKEGVERPVVEEDVVIAAAAFDELFVDAERTDRLPPVVLALVKSKVLEDQTGGENDPVTVNAALYKELKNFGASEGPESTGMRDRRQEWDWEEETGDETVSVSSQRVKELLKDAKAHASKRRVRGDVFLDLVKQRYLPSTEEAGDTPKDMPMRFGQLRELEKLAGDPPEYFLNLLERLGSTGDDALSADKKHFVEDVISRMPTRLHRQVLEWRYGEGFTSSQISGRVEKSLQATRSLISRVRNGFVELAYDVTSGTPEAWWRKEDPDFMLRVSSENIHTLIAKAEPNARYRDVAGDMALDLFSKQLLPQAKQSEYDNTMLISCKQLRELEKLAEPDYPSLLDKFHRGDLRPDQEILVERALLFMGEYYRELLEQHYLEGLTAKEIFTRLQDKSDISPGAVATALSRAKQSFQDTASDYANDNINLKKWRRNARTQNNVLCLLDAFGMPIPSDARVDALNSSAKEELERQVAALDISVVGSILNLKISEISADKIRSVVEDMYGLKDGKPKQLIAIGKMYHFSIEQVLQIEGLVVGH